MNPFDKMARDVLRHYPLPGVSMPSTHPAGFSGALIWQIRALHEGFCLRAWPAGVTAVALHAIHKHMKHAAALSFVPRVVAGRHHQTIFLHEGRLWDVTTWMPGRADFHQRPTPLRLAAACTALARLHQLWGQGATHAPAVCPAILRRRQRLRYCLQLIAQGWQPTFAAGDPISPWAEDAWRLLQARLPGLDPLLELWTNVTLPIQPCLCDIWHDHVLFEGDTVSGLIDYGSVKQDNVAVDLARLLGSLVGDDRAPRQAGLAAYEMIRPLSDHERRLVDVLDETGTLLGAANWLIWLYHEQKQYEDRAAVAKRLAALVRRIDMLRTTR